MKIEIKEKEKLVGLTFADVPNNSFYTLYGGLYFKLDAENYLDFSGSFIMTGKITGYSSPNRIPVPAGTKIEITV